MLIYNNRTICGVIIVIWKKLAMRGPTSQINFLAVWYIDSTQLYTLLYRCRRAYCKDPPSKRMLLISSVQVTLDSLSRYLTATNLFPGVTHH